MNVCAVPTILDLTVGFTRDSAEPKLLNIIQGRRCVAEMYVRLELYVSGYYVSQLSVLCNFSPGLNSVHCTESEFLQLQFTHKYVKCVSQADGRLDFCCGLLLQTFVVLQKSGPATPNVAATNCAKWCQVI